MTLSQAQSRLAREFPNAVSCAIEDLHQQATVIIGVSSWRTVIAAQTTLAAAVELAIRTVRETQPVPVAERYPVLQAAIPAELLTA